jgi:hypothetical protein
MPTNSVPPYAFQSVHVNMNFETFNPDRDARNKEQPLQGAYNPLWYLINGLATLEAEELFDGGAGEEGKRAEFRAREVFEDVVNAQWPRGLAAQEAKPP